MTAVATPPASTRPLPGDEAVVVTVFANLLPEEVVAGRRLRALQRRLVMGLAGLVVLLIGVYAVSWWQTENSRSNLSDAQQHTTTLNNQLKEYQPLLAAQAQAASIGQTLSTLMTNDLSWRDLVDRVQKQALGGVQVTGVAGTLTSATPTTGSDPLGGLPLLNQSGKAVVGTVTITGITRDKRSLAAFVDRIGTIRGLTAPLPATLTGDHGPLTYTINVLITSDALGGRFTKTPISPTGDN